MRTTNFEKAVKGATKTKNAAPKSKYIEHILTATNSDAGVAEIFRTLQYRLRDSTWTIVFKSLIVIHMMVREGSPGAALSYLSQNPQKVAITSITEVQQQGGNIWRYSEYLVSRSMAFQETKADYVCAGEGKLKRLTVSKGLLRETEVVQKQIQALVKCDLLSDEPETEITLTAFRLLTLDVLTLFSVMNEGTINVLEHYFEMSRSDSERALNIYKKFSQLTEEVVNFLRIARQYEHATRLEIPNLKHASTDLTKLLEDDLNDPDFTNRRKQYRIQKYGSDKGGEEDAPQKRFNFGQDSKQKKATTSDTASKPPQLSKPDAKAPPPDLIDFFDSIEQNQQPMAHQQQPQQIPSFQQPNFQNLQYQQFQQTGFQPQQNFQQQQQQQQPQPQPPQQLQQQPGFQQPAQTSFSPQEQQSTQGGNPFGQPQPLQPNYTGAGFGGYTPQPNAQAFQSTLPTIPQEGTAAPFQRPMHTGPARASNPFRQSMLPLSDNSSPSPPSFNNPNPPAAPLQRQNTNPFARHSTYGGPQISGNTSAFSSPGPLQQQGQVQQLQPQRTGTNPFAKAPASPGQQQSPQPPAAAPLRPNLTGSTNPFRQSQLINQQTGQGWQNGVPQGTIGGLESQETRPIFPRPGQAA